MKVDMEWIDLSQNHLPRHQRNTYYPEVQCGWTACSILATQRYSITGLASRRQSSSISYVATAYRCSPYLDEALRCVAIRSKRVLAPTSSFFDKAESSHYGAALRSLQKAIDDPVERNQPGVLGAIHLLSLFELLQSTRQEIWTLHTAGASRLVRMKGPDAFKSDSDIRLLLSMITSIVSLTL
ncbi:hypothetical protein M426DRAFT_16150 [Hypoxylon sp. CI-4A]|nr:hypothetical protein M426DRAFT_16150 [Hypoxylon sp. CI-4A]